MKKIIIASIFTILVIPNFVLAAWWNPLSWFNKWSFSEKTTKTEVLEKRIQELENKLATTSTTSVSTTFYVKYDNSKIRKCPSTDCDVIGYLKINTDMTVQGDRVYHLSDLPDWMNHTNPDGLKGYVNKSILSENPVKVDNSAQVNTNRTIEKSPNSQNNVSTYSKDTAISLIDTWINNQESELSYINQYKETIDWGEKRFKEIREVALHLLDDATWSSDSYLMGQTKYLLQISDGVIKFSGLARAGVESSDPGNDSIQSLLKYIDNHVVELRKYREQIPQIYLNEEVSKTELLKLISANTAYKHAILDKTHNAISVYLDFLGEAISRKDDTVSELKSYFSQNRTVSNTIINTPIYQPMIIPQLQVPKTTNCTMGPMAGARGYYTVSCY
jgi:hypothetical protein